MSFCCFNTRAITPEPLPIFASKVENSQSAHPPSIISIRPKFMLSPSRSVKVEELGVIPHCAAPVNKKKGMSINGKQETVFYAHSELENSKHKEFFAKLVDLLNKKQFNIPGEMVLVCNSKLRVVAHTENAINMTQYISDEILGKNLSVFLPYKTVQQFETSSGNFEDSVYGQSLLNRRVSYNLMDLATNPFTAPNQVASLEVNLFPFLVKKVYLCVLLKTSLGNQHARNQELSADVESLFQALESAISSSSYMTATNPKEASLPIDSKLHRRGSFCYVGKKV